MKTPENTLQLNEDLGIPLREISISAIRSQGAGGQNVNKVSSAVHLRFDIANSPSLPQNLKDRLLATSDGRVTSEGVIVIKAQRHRSQEMNRTDALDKLRQFLATPLIESKPRKKTRPSKAARERRMESKSRRGRLKASRSRPDPE